MKVKVEKMGRGLLYVVDEEGKEAIIPADYLYSFLKRFGYELEDKK